VPEGPRPRRPSPAGLRPRSRASRSSGSWQGWWRCRANHWPVLLRPSGASLMSPDREAATAPRPRTRSRIPMVRMSSMPAPSGAGRRCWRCDQRDADPCAQPSHRLDAADRHAGSVVLPATDLPGVSSVNGTQRPSVARVRTRLSRQWFRLGRRVPQSAGQLRRTAPRPSRPPRSPLLSASQPRQVLVVVAHRWPTSPHSGGVPTGSPQAKRRKAPKTVRTYTEAVA
jgi:hypothetical protein